MLTGLPHELLQVFHRSITTEYVTVDPAGQPIAWPVTPYFHPEGGCIDLSTGLGYPRKAHNAQRNPHVALLFSDPTGSGLDDPPMVLVQGTATVDDRDLEANRERYARESAAKLPATRSTRVPQALRRLADWYFTRIYVHVRPERIYRWPHADPEAEPELLDAHLDEVRSGHNEEPEERHLPSSGGPGRWSARLDELGREYATAVLAVVGPDGFPFAVRMPVRADRAARVVRFGADPVGAPLEPGLACLTAHAHAPDFTWQRNFQVRGSLAEEDGRWVLHPHKVVGGFELPPGSPRERWGAYARKDPRMRRTARAVRARRTS
jgi:Pyridoxamine 5'-phosphate oxidase